MNSGRGCRDVKPVSNVNARDQISNREREGTGDKEKEERESVRRGRERSGRRWYRDSWCTVHPADRIDASCLLESL